MVTSRERMENGTVYQNIGRSMYPVASEGQSKKMQNKSMIHFRIPFCFGGKGRVGFFLGPHQWNLKYLKSLSPMLVWATARRSKCMKTWSVPLAILQAKTIQVLIHDSCTPKWLSAKPQLERTVSFVRSGCDQICMSFEWCSTTLCLHHSSLYPP